MGRTCTSPDPLPDMWRFTPIGFSSAVRKPGDRFPTVRARVAGDLE